MAIPRLVRGLPVRAKTAYDMTIAPPSGIPAPGPAPGAPPPSGHFSVPDWASLISGDPEYQATAAQIRASGAQAGRARRTAIQRALIEAGFAPPGWKGGYGDVDEPTLAAARGNQTSTLAQLNRQRGHSRADLAAVLAGRGMLSSGALTGGEQTIQTGYEQANSEAQRRLMDALGGYESSYADAANQLALQDLQARQAAGSRLEESYMPTWIADPAQQGAVAPGVAPTAYPSSGQLLDPYADDAQARLVKYRTAYGI